MKKLLSLAILSIFLFNCTGSDSKETEVEELNKSLNITILLDLSDRLIRDINPSQKERDIAIISELTNIFKNSMESQGAFLAKDKIRVILNPLPNDSNINTIVSDLSIDLEDLEPPQKKSIYDNIEDIFNENLDQIYQSTLDTKNWNGSDIWRFFKNDVDDIAVIDDKSFTNILVILTDGYIYHKDSAKTEGNRTTYLTNSFLRRVDLYTKPDWKDFLTSNNYGLVNIDEDFSPLNVLFLEVNPMRSYLEDEDIIKWYLGEWLDNMNVNNFRIYNTDVAPNTSRRIDNFFKNI